MTVSGLCFACTRVPNLFDRDAPPSQPVHCYGGGDEPGTPGLIGSGFHCSCECRSWPHQPAALYDVAAKEHPGDVEAIRDRYRELMIEHGHIVKREPGQSVNLPCGWPHRPEPDDVTRLGRQP